MQPYILKANNMDQYLHISADQEKNIAVLRIKDTDMIIESVEIRQRLQNVLEQYFGLSIKIHSLEQLDFSFVEVKVVVTIGNDKEASWTTNIYLNETWLY